MDQDSLDTIAENLGVSYEVLDNLQDGKKVYRASITLINNCPIKLEYGKWSVYFCHIRMIEPSVLPHPDGVVLPQYGIRFHHINGWLFKFEPTETFRTLKQNDSLRINFKAQYYSAGKSDIMPNWYIAYEGLKSKIIRSTAGESLDFVAPFSRPCQWKRYDYVMDNGSHRCDHYNPFNPEERFLKNSISKQDDQAIHIIPTPLQMKIDINKTVNITKNWIIRVEEDFQQEAKFLSEKIGMTIEPMKSKESSKKQTINITSGKVTLPKNDEACQKIEAYKLTVSTDQETVTVVAIGKPGAFYAVQSLLSLLHDGLVPECEIIDAPRYPYRGMHLDVARNFHGKVQVLKLLETMAMYKMNKLHLHLTDDDGWRIEIPGLEELTTVGAKRGHDMKEKTCLIPLLGSGPDFDTSGSGHYSVEDYKEILTYAKQRHIEVIPEIDIPGHSHAALKGMNARYDKYMEMKDKKSAEEYLVTDLDDVGIFKSVQMFSENAMNPGVKSTYKFIDKVVGELKALHADISPLKIFHFGGDEVPYEAWQQSPACKKLVAAGEVKCFDDLMEHFVKKVAKIVADHELCLGAWQDGVIHDDILFEPMKRSQFPNEQVYVYAWQNVWESGLAGCAYKLANEGYKVVMAQGTHLYFDHPYEPDPDERGLYWASRYIDTKKTFGFMPDNLYANADFKLTGDPIQKDDLTKNGQENISLLKPDNIVGMQGQLWTELVRTSNQMDSMIFPRIIAVAERAWHKASWETIEDDSKRIPAMTVDWSQFAWSLGYRELQRLDSLGVSYHLPPPGAKIDGGKLELNCTYPGLPMEYSLDGGNTWQSYFQIVEVPTIENIYLQTRSADGKRTSRVVVLKQKKLGTQEE